MTFCLKQIFFDPNFTSKMKSIVVIRMYFLIIILFLELNFSDVIDDKMYRRARHVITENERTSQAVKALKSKSIEEFGHLMNESHNSLRYV